VEAEDWTDELPLSCMARFPRAPGINDDPTMRSLQNDAPAKLCANGPSRSAGCELLSCVRKAAAVSSS
jgi:hypothetical protein